MSAISLEDQLAVGLQLLLAGLLSAVIGLDRERFNYRAGLRTHMLVGIGACLFTAISIRAFPNDPARIASQILPGIGFLGAGTILKMGSNIRGLTTAASIWATSSIGLAIGLGAWLLAIIGSLTIWFTLAIVKRIEPNHAQEQHQASD